MPRFPSGWSVNTYGARRCQPAKASLGHVKASRDWVKASSSRLAARGSRLAGQRSTRLGRGVTRLDQSVTHATSRRHVSQERGATRSALTSPKPPLATGAERQHVRRRGRVSRRKRHPARSTRHSAGSNRHARSSRRHVSRERRHALRTRVTNATTGVWAECQDVSRAAMNPADARLNTSYAAIGG